MDEGFGEIGLIPIYFGYDERESIGAYVFMNSVLTRASEPISFIPLHLDTVRKFYKEKHTDGTNNFIYSRFLIPYMQGYQGWAIFVDGADMLCRADIAELWKLRDQFGKAVQVVKHDYKTTAKRKYIGTDMEADNQDYPRKNWSSVMLINCGHYAWRLITPSFIESAKGSFLHRFEFLKDDEIGELPKEWNHIVWEQPPNKDAKIVHYSLGIPGFDHYQYCEFSDEWFYEKKMMEWSANGIRHIQQPKIKHC